MTTTQQDADLIRVANAEADIIGGAIGTTLRRTAARIAELTQQLETERLRLAACGVIASANTRSAAPESRKMHPDYWSGSAKAVADAVDREMALREKVAELTQPAPLALSAEESLSWGSLVSWARHGAENNDATKQDRAILAVDKLLRQRVTPLTDDEIKDACALISLSGQTLDEYDHEVARAVEAAHGITDGNKKVGGEA